MDYAPKRPGPPRYATARVLVLLVGAFVLAGCVPEAPPPISGALPADRTLVVMRLVGELVDGTPDNRMWPPPDCLVILSRPLGVRDEQGDTPWAPGMQALRAGVRNERWLLLSLRPGHHLVAVAMIQQAQSMMSCGPPPAAMRWTNLTIVAPAGAGPVYAGTLRLVTQRWAPGIAIATPVRDESDLARAAIAAWDAGLPPVTTSLAMSYPPPLAALGLPPPAAPALGVDGRRWIAAIDWNQFVLGGPRAPAQAPAPRGDASARNKEGAADSPKDLEAAGQAAGAAAAVAGGAAVVAGAAVIALPLGMVISVAQAQRAGEAEQAWGPCAQRIAETLTPENVERHLRSAFATAGAPAQSPWRVTVTRVALRRCGPPDSNYSAAGTYGIEVASDWVGRVGGVPAYDVRFVRRVDGARADRRLIGADLAPDDVAVEPPAPCRHVAQYCSPEGAALLLQDVADGLAAARDAIVRVR